MLQCMLGKGSKEIQHAYKRTPDPMVKGKSFEKCKKEQMDVQCASAVGSLMNVWIKSYP